MLFLSRITCGSYAQHNIKERKKERKMSRFEGRMRGMIQRLLSENVNHTSRFNLKRKYLICSESFHRPQTDLYNCSLIDHIQKITFARGARKSGPTRTPDSLDYKIK